MTTMLRRGITRAGKAMAERSASLHQIASKPVLQQRSLFISRSITAFSNIPSIAQRNIMPCSAFASPPSLCPIARSASSTPNPANQPQGASTIEVPTATGREQFMIFLVVAVGISVFAFDAYYLTYIHPRAPPTLAPFEFRNFTLAEKIPVSHDTILLRFNADLPQVDLPEGIPLPSHVVVKDDSCQIARSYTPITYGRKHFDLLVKKYDNGSLSSFLHKIEIGDAVPMRGPISTVPYVPNAVDEIGLIAGGTGITPLYQLIKRVLKDPVDKTRLKLVYANRSPADILLRAELDLLSAAHPDRLKVVYVVDTVRNQKQWQGQVGSVTRKILQQNLPDPKQGLKAGVLVCGPDGFINHVAGAKPSEDEQGPLNGLLKELGFQDRQVYKL